MILKVELLELIYVAFFILSVLVAGGWKLLHQLVFKPLDQIAKELRQMRSLIEPKVFKLESDLENLPCKRGQREEVCQ